VSTVDQDSLLWICTMNFLISEGLGWGIFVFSHEVKLSFYPLLKKLDASYVSIFWSFYMLIDN